MKDNGNKDLSVPPTLHAKVDQSHSTTRRAILGSLAGGSLFLVIMLVLAVAAVAFGMITLEENGSANLETWLILEVIGGLAAGVCAGALSRHIARRNISSVILSIVIFVVSFLESAEIYSRVSTGEASTPAWLLLFGPFAATSGILLGGWRYSSPGATDKKPE